MKKLQGAAFRDGNREFALTFELAFPQIAHIEVVVDETGPGNEGLGRRTLTRRSVREWTNCSNPHCAGQGFQLGELLRQMVAARQSHESGEFTCQSREESGTPCPNRFQIEVSLNYQ